MHVALTGATGFVGSHVLTELRQRGHDDQGTDAAKARTELNWRPSRPGLVEELRHGSYRKVAAR